MKNFDIQIIENKKTSNSKIVRKTIRFKAKNNHKMTFNDIVKYYDYLIEEKNMDANNISILGMNDMFRTIKTFDSNELKPWDEVDYYEDKPNKKQLQKILNEFFYVDFVFKK